jgi:hypothetical protein
VDGGQRRMFGSFHSRARNGHHHNLNVPAPSVRACSSAAVPGSEAKRDEHAAIVGIRDADAASMVVGRLLERSPGRDPEAR